MYLLNYKRGPEILNIIGAQNLIKNEPQKSNLIDTILLFFLTFLLGGMFVTTLAMHKRIQSAVPVIDKGSLQQNL